MMRACRWRKRKCTGPILSQLRANAMHEQDPSNLHQIYAQGPLVRRSTVQYSAGLKELLGPSVDGIRPRWRPCGPVANEVAIGAVWELQIMPSDQGP